jgi:mRNA-degrading endonuclease HigB of HigAB toxin-antitoxin module
MTNKYLRFVSSDKRFISSVLKNRSAVFFGNPAGMKYIFAFTIFKKPEQDHIFKLFGLSRILVFLRYKQPPVLFIKFR